MNSEQRFEEIYNKYFKITFRFVYSRISNFQDTEDIVSETFSAVWNTVENIDLNSNVKAFVLKIASYKLTDFLRKKYKIEANFAEIDFEEKEEFLEILNNDQESELKDQKTKKLKNLLHSLVEELNERDRELVKLKYEDNLTISEIAQKMNISEGNVKVINNRLIKKLKEKWEKMK
jgi:RNA polymerase sigma-70 factor (ECF subfamily)